MSQERLEEIKNNYLVGTHSLFGIPYISMPKENFDWLIKRVEELEKFKRSAEQLYKNYHLSAKRSVAEKEELREQNKHYREALEFYANRENYNPKHYDPNSDNGYMSTIDYDEGEKARQALESCNDE